MNVETQALLLDEINARAPAESLDTVAREYSDEMIRATRAAHDTVHRLSNIQQGDLVDSPEYSELCDTIRLGAMTTIAATNMGTIDVVCGCELRQAMWCAAAWEPGKIACPDHVYLLEPKDRVAAFTCDVCGRHDENLAPVTTQLGALLYMAGFCRDCIPPLPSSSDRHGPTRQQRRASARRENKRRDK